MSVDSRKEMRKKRAEKFGAYIRRLRESKGWSLREVEEKSGKSISNPYLSQVERGERNVPHLDLIERLAKTYGEPLDNLLKAANFEVGKSQLVTAKDELAEGYDRLSPNGRRLLLGFLQLLEAHDR